ncbi:MAG TPA: DUF1553 domain-containing protein, partial [Pirellulaceae bacterium]|nr:DUF1553 domain-containing protein [Pirellulaceae bacterium]
AIDVTEQVPTESSNLPPALVAALRIAVDQRTPAQAKLVTQAFEQAAPQPMKPKTAPTTSTAEVMIMQELKTPRPTFVSLRGDFLRPDKQVGELQPGVLSAVAPKLPTSVTRNRLDLARWLVHPQNPLTPRVTMNRVWMRYFGRGLVETEEDFGTQGSPPTHPELLDWLASEFIRSGWSPKAMHRLIVTSATYRQASQTRPELIEIDPRNLLLARQERVRVEAEIVRDAVLSASGLLNRNIGGPSGRPPQPEGVYAFTQNAKKWTADLDTLRFRRGMYTTFYRSAPYPLFTTFDAPDFQTVCTRRNRSNTPLQALTVANDVAFVELAQGLAARVLREVPEDNVDARLRRAFLLCLAREPGPEELQLLRAYHQRQLDRYGNDQQAAAALLSKDLTNSKTPPAMAAAWVCVARTIINTDAFITRE